MGQRADGGMGSRRPWKPEWTLHLHADHSPVRVLLLGRSRGRRGSVTSPEARKPALDPGPRTPGFVLGDANLRGVGTFSLHAEIGILKCFFAQILEAGTGLGRGKGQREKLRFAGPGRAARPRFRASGQALLPCF